MATNTTTPMPMKIDLAMLGAGGGPGMPEIGLPESLLSLLGGGDALSWGGGMGSGMGSGVPVGAHNRVPVDLWEEKYGDLYVAFELPGVEGKNIRLEVDEHQVFLSFEKSPPPCAAEIRFLR